MNFRHFLLTFYFLFLIAVSTSCALFPTSSEPSDTAHENEANYPEPTFHQVDPGEDPVMKMALSFRGVSHSQTQARPEMDEDDQIRIRQAARERDIVLNMSMDDVYQAWGHPIRQEYAGNPNNGNARWIYAEGLTQSWSLGRTRTVFFEAGRVVGWQTR